MPDYLYSGGPRRYAEAGPHQFNGRKNLRWTRDTLLEAVHAFYVHHQRFPTPQEYGRPRDVVPDLPSITSIWKYYARIEDMHHDVALAYGIAHTEVPKSGRHVPLTREEMIAMVQAWILAHDNAMPTYAHYRNGGKEIPRLPTMKTFQRFWKSHRLLNASAGLRLLFKDSSDAAPR